MTPTPEQLDRIEAYLDGQLTEAERLAFERELDQDTDLFNETELQRELRLGLLAIAKPELQLEQQIVEISQAVKAARQRYQDSNNGRLIPFFGAARHMAFRYGAVAASVLVLLGVGWWNLQQRREDYTLVESEVGVEDNLSDTQLKQLPPDLLEKKLKNKNTTASRQRFEWLLARSYWQQGKIAKARVWLLRIRSNPNHAYREEAQKLLNELPKTDRKTTPTK